MASSISLASPILLVILFHLVLEIDHTCFASNATQKTPTGLRITLTRGGFGKKLSNSLHALNSLSEAENGAKHRTYSSITSRVRAHEDEYVMELTSGTPPVKFSAIMDTGSDLIWTKCKRKTSSSSSLSKVSEGCDTLQIPAICKQKYADGKSIKVTMVRELLTIGDGKTAIVTFGCGIPGGKDNFMYDGVVGMGRGKLSLVSQLNESVFSYCLDSSSEKGILLIGSKAVTAITNSNFQTTTLITQGKESYYYISLEGISVGQTRLPIDKSNFAIKENNRGGMIIDSGTTFTYLEKGIIDMIENEFFKQTKLNKSKDGYTPYTDLNRCFNSPYDANIIPKLVFHFSGANWDVPRENYIYEKKGKACLAFIANHKKDAQLSIFGNMQQQNMMVLYDLDKNSLSFMPAKCNQL
ncbi:hypothetical protein L2E82_35726 [Cichorium intybus]|uniref:Uncharacterized protein n=1 Tax=Cichorium intybus TaxID=13427 RepID=A0ACB9BPJ1_CICIN|nr:hypothetical protein L2E82_35726 [Cichorium intybus]